jgi:hypothetical protein
MSKFTKTDAFADPEDSKVVSEAKLQPVDITEYSYTEVGGAHIDHPTKARLIRIQRDVTLYNLGVGATAKELQWTYEGSDDFGALPTFGVIPQFPASSGVPLDWLPNFNPVYSTQFLRCSYTY